MKKYADADVVALRFRQGGVIGCEKDPNYQLTEREMVTGFLEALRHAELPDRGPGVFMVAQIETDRLELVLKRQPKNELPPFFSFCTFMPENGYGPQFDQMLVKLGDYRATQMHDFIQKHRPSIISTEIEGYTHTLYPTDLANFLDELERGEGRDLFNYFDAGGSLRLTFALKYWKKRNFYLSVRDYLPHEEGQPKVVNPSLTAVFQQAIIARGDIEE